MTSQIKQEADSGRVKRRNIALSEMSKMGIEGYGRDTPQCKAVDLEQLLTEWKHELGHISLLKPSEQAKFLEYLIPYALTIPGSPTIDTEKPRVELSQSLPGGPSTEEDIDAYLTYMEDGGAAAGYLTVRARKLRFFARQYPQLPTDPEVLRAYLRQFKTADVPTRRDQWTALTALYKFASRTNRIKNPMLDVDKPRFKKKPGQRLSRDEAKLVLAATRTDLEWALMTCYFGLRFRRIEAERLLFGHIHSDYLIVQGKERTEELPLLPVFHDKLLRLQRNHGHRPNDPLFPIKGDTMAYHIKQIFKRAGIVGARGSPHTLRNTAGALWATFGGDWTSNRQLLRHSEKTMTDHYSPLSIDELRVKDYRYNPMLNLMREMGLAPDMNYTNTGNVRLPFTTPAETASKGQILLTTTGKRPDIDSVRPGVPLPDPAQQLPELLDQMIALGEMTHGFKRALGGNGHWPEQVEELLAGVQLQIPKEQLPLWR